MSTNLVTAPGVYLDMPMDLYLTDPVLDGSLSPTRAKTLLQEAGPAKYRHYAASPQTKPEYDLGHAAHAVALGKGGELLVLVDADSWRTKAAQQERDLAHSEGKTPLLPKQMRQVEDMAAALSGHKLAVETLAGESEVSMFHQRDDGLWLRGRMDVQAEGWTADYKTCADASGFGFLRSAWNFRYYMQAAWYRRLRAWLTGDWLPYRIVAQESTAPYLVSVWEVDEGYLRQGESDMDEAIGIYQQCMRSGEWPGYPDDIQTLTPPAWAIDDDIQIGA